jgi:hypothetical protein
MNTYLVTHAIAVDPENMVFDNKVQYFLCDADNRDDAIEQLHRHQKYASVLMVYTCTPA